MNNAERITEIEKRLTTAFQPTCLVVKDQSAMHHGHAGAASGAGHFSLTIAAEAFQDNRY